MSTPTLDLTRTALGIELGSTRIKAVLTDPSGTVLATGGHDWENSLVDGIWTYSLDGIITGIQAAYAALAADLRTTHAIELATTGAIGVSAMMHGYVALDADGNLLTRFRTWRNTMTASSSRTLSQRFGLNIPQRWTVSHLHHAVTGHEAHVPSIDRVTTLAGYVHWRLTGRHVLGVGEASGVFPIGPDNRSFDTTMLEAFDDLIAAEPAVTWSLRDVLPDVALAGQEAGTLTAEGAALLDPTGVLHPGVPLCPPEGDAGTGMVATNAVRPRTGNVSAGTSAFAMIVLEEPLRTLIEEIDLVATPSGAPVAMAHANTCTSDLNAWVEVFSQFAQVIGAPVERGALFDILLGAAAEGSMDEAGVMSYNFLSGDALVGLSEGRPLTVRRPEARFSLAGLMRSHLFALFAAMAHGVRILRGATNVRIDSMHAHGGIFTTPGIPQRTLAAAFDTPVSVAATASEGGAWGMALLAGYRLWSQGRSLEDYLDEAVFAGAQEVTIEATPEEVAEYARYLDRFVGGLPLQRTAVEVC
ncbi:xylulokinase [Actinomyces respiraculi]|uniref:xylulokinase n=1 Tax=Actinomyces respiraculi TaxID=2744574 RepID=UPI00141E8722|nr:FGGY-family carbohydrate kinase [Actinomyces respiraculi]